MGNKKQEKIVDNITTILDLENIDDLNDMLLLEDYLKKSIIRIILHI